jgi:zinc transport system substrate-binding protein
MAGAIAAELSRLDPANAAAYAANAARLDHRLDETSARLTAELAPVKDRPFIVFHDAYQYFERDFGLSGVGSITDIAGAPPSAQRLKDIQDKIRSTQAACVFREPQFPADRVVAITADTGTRTGVLDPLGAGLTPGPEAYPTLLDDLAASLKTCLSG